MRDWFAASAREDRERAVAIGCKTFIWRSSGAEDACSTCAKLDGKRFRYAKPPTAGFPGELTCCEIGWCRCYAEAVIPGFN
ncbi:hypothetical protein [Roseomonas xinghualingensis]|uniref:hypothetical protein n=1 Tax=Roseomonas xinghualingensis TaxID=2986475 RepID=UPI0021F12A5F|nr:hypothetical protein [Roseomonas sp. SXEYE001]MCV4206900.1 hypothetical protein [Roseomonas sp. SXEYE001]